MEKEIVFSYFTIETIHSVFFKSYSRYSLQSFLLVLDTRFASELELMQKRISTIIGARIREIEYLALKSNTTD